MAELKLQEGILHWHTLLLSEHLHQIALQQEPETVELWSASAISVSKWTDEKILGLLKSEKWGFLMSKTGGGLQKFLLTAKWVGILYPPQFYFSFIYFPLWSFFFWLFLLRIARFCFLLRRCCSWRSKLWGSDSVHSNGPELLTK